MTETTEIRRALSALDSYDVDDRAAAVDTLVEARYEAAIPQLMQVLADENAGVRYKAATALGIFANESAIPALLTTLRDSDPFVRVAVINSLLRIGEASMTGLVEALRDENKAVRRAAAKAIGKLSLANCDANEAINNLLVALLDVDPDVRRFAAEALGRIGSETTALSLGDALRDNQPRVREAAASALRALGQHGVPVLLEALADPNPDVGMVAIFTLKDMGYSPSSGVLR